MSTTVDAATEPRAPRRRAVRITAWILGVLGLLLVIGLAGAGWYYSSQLIAYPDFATDELPHEVTAVDGDTVTYRGAPLWTEDAVSQRSGAVHLDGYAQLGPFLATSDCCTTRRTETLAGGPLEVGDRFRLDSAAFPADLDDVAGRPIEVVRTDGPLGEYEARFSPAAGAARTWLVFVHGRGGDLHDGYRLLSAMDDPTVPFLSTSFRNDGWAPDSPDGYGHFGLTEWEDLEAWVAFAEARGADEIVLACASMGASVVATFLRRSERADIVSGVILDSPMLDIQAAVEAGARNAGLQPPLMGPIVWAGKVFADLRAGYDFAALSHIDRAEETFGDRPVLVVHGTADTTTPIGPSRRFAQQLGDQVTLVEFEDAGHVRPWNVDPVRYRTAVREFLEHVRS